jgi:hypothetical protein
MHCGYTTRGYAQCGRAWRMASHVALSISMHVIYTTAQHGGRTGGHPGGRRTGGHSCGRYTTDGHTCSRCEGRRTLRRKRCLGIGEHKIPGGVEREKDQDQEKSEKGRER